MIGALLTILVVGLVVWLIIYVAGALIPDAKIVQVIRIVALVLFLIWVLLYIVPIIPTHPDLR